MLQTISSFLIKVYLKDEDIPAIVDLILCSHLFKHSLLETKGLTVSILNLRKEKSRSLRSTVDQSIAMT